MAKAFVAMSCLGLVSLVGATVPGKTCAEGAERCAAASPSSSDLLLLQKFSALSSTPNGSTSGGSVVEEEQPYIWQRDPIHLRAHTGKRLTMQDESVHAEWFHQGVWETFTIELKGGRDRIVRMGDVVYLRGHTGKRITVDGDEVNAKYGDDRSKWQEFVIEPSPPPAQCDRTAPWTTWEPACHEAVRELHVGDAISLRAHTGKRVTVQDATVHAKWENQGHWETLVIEKTHQEELSGHSYTQCECCGCGSEEEEDAPCPDAAGNSVLVTDLGLCLEAYKGNTLDFGDHCPPGSHWVGVISSQWYPSGCFLTRGMADGCEWWNIGFNTIEASDTSSTCCGRDAQVCRKA